MIARIRGPNGQDLYLGLQDTKGRKWEAVTREPTGVHGAAVLSCIEALENQLLMLHLSVGRRHTLIVRNLKRLFDAPKKRDKVFVHGKPCQLDKDGFLILPEPGGIWDIEPIIVQVFIEFATGRREMLADDWPLVKQALDDPKQFLTAVAATEPDVFAKVAAFMAQLYREQQGLPPLNRVGRVAIAVQMAIRKAGALFRRG